ncbi:MAG: hypothetical protein F6J94_31805 [Moorea sp. SIO1F2]|uniref:hypothetical protein n=1 Tax=unclassified Moorena TaxID=2683338 RepID=UPI0013BBC811|nr:MULTISPECIES: hypothetical protein [unclassified Moorena]NEN95290.1 hypothetical protein [Moorena sp. SIO3I7]NEO47057.1 hypothetical protein [Moorena sp. SIO4A3]NEO59597.1 hypothetical protein [Moorena sp. SIO4G2]NEO04639.1 hypothetical protein [Moorena sp. SIO3I8]NEO19809.1 hypothetical protein [Moorena sp. SIO4A5]
MTISITGVIERKDIGSGAWALVSDSGETYELKDTPAQLKQSGLKVTVTGEVREDVMTFAMIGPVLEIKSFELLD